jgi:hypothetical protein
MPGRYTGRSKLPAFSGFITTPPHASQNFNFQGRSFLDKEGGEVVGYVNFDKINKLKIGIDTEYNILVNHKFMIIRDTARGSEGFFLKSILLGRNDCKKYKNALVGGEEDDSDDDLAGDIDEEADDSQEDGEGGCSSNNANRGQEGGGDIPRKR